MKKKTLITLLAVLAVAILVTVLIITAPQKVTVAIYQLGSHESLDLATLGFIDQLEKEFGAENVSWIRDFKATFGDTSTGYRITETFFKNQGADIVLVNSTQGLQAAHESGENGLPVVAAAITSYAEALGLEGFDGVVGGRITGTSDLADPESQVKMMQEICALIPELGDNGTRNIKIGIIHNTAEDASNYEVREVEKFLEQYGFDYVEYLIVSQHDVAQKVAQAAAECDAIYLPYDHTVAESVSDVNNIVKQTIANGKRLPVFTSNDNICKDCGGVTAFSVDYYDIGVATAKMAAKILRGEADISTMEVEHATAEKKYNKEIAELLGITVPSDYKEIK